MHYELDGAGLIPSDEDCPHHPPHAVPDNRTATATLAALSRSHPNVAHLLRSHEEDQLTHVFSHLLDSKHHPLPLATAHLADSGMATPTGMPACQRKPHPLLAAVQAQHLGALPSGQLTSSASSSALLNGASQKAYCNNQTQQNQNNHQQFSSASDTQPQPPPLRKSSSAVDWFALGNAAEAAATNKELHCLTSRPAAFIVGGGGHRSESPHHFHLPHLSLLAGSHPHLAHIDEPHTGGLVMTIEGGASSATQPSSLLAGQTAVSASSAAATTGAEQSKKMSTVPSTSSTGMGHHQLTGCGTVSSTSGGSTGALASSAITGNKDIAGSSLAGTSSASTSCLPLDAARHAEQHATAHHEHKGGVLASYLRSGFLGREVLRTDEESYRYIMALDR